MKPFFTPALFAMTLAQQAVAGWPTDPTQNMPICTNLYLHQFPAVTTDKYGGAIVVWEDDRETSNSLDIYAQRVTLAGTIGWPVNGVLVSTALGEQTSPHVVPDGHGGAIVTWLDNRGGTGNDVYAQRITSAGTPAWQVDGMPICDIAGEQLSVQLASDGDGGAVIVWTDHRDSPTTDIYAQRVSFEGSTLWPEDGVLVCGASGDQGAPQLTSFEGGAVIVWVDDRAPSGFDVYAQRLNAFGAAQWQPDGIAVCTALSTQNAARVTSVGDVSPGSVLVHWTDSRTSPSNLDIYSQLIDAEGTMSWTADGVAVCTAIGTQSEGVAYSLGDGSFVLCWTDFRNGGGPDIYSSRIDQFGNPSWGVNGLPVCTAPNASIGPRIVTDGMGGTIMVWQDDRDDPFRPDIYAQRVAANGSALWATNGVAVSSADWDQHRVQVVADGAGGAVIAWEDWRDGGFLAQRYKIFAQRIGPDGSLETPTAVGPTAPPKFRQLDISPNPFSQETTLSLVLDRSSALLIEVFSVTGEKVATTRLPELASGSHRIPFAALDRHGRILPSGTYLCRASSATGTFLGKLTITH